MMVQAGDRSALLEDWRRRSREAQWGHHAAYRQLMRAHYSIGIPLTALATFAGTAVFSAMSTSSSGYFKATVAVTAVVVAILGGLQTFLRLADRASSHRETAAEYSRIRRDVELALADSSSVSVDHLGAIKEALDGAASRAPAIPELAWRRTQRVLAKRS
jgi:hypothetical protein